MYLTTRADCLGFYPLSAKSVRRAEIEEAVTHALYRCTQGTEAVGAHGAYLDSLSERSTTFYASLGFVAVGDSRTPQPMYLPMSILRMA